MPRPTYPNDFLRAFVFQPDGGSTLVAATRDRATDGATPTYIISPDTFGDVDLDGDTIYEVSFGPFFLANGDGGVATNARDGAQARILFYINEIGAAEALPDYADFILRKPAPFRYTIDQVKTYYYSDIPRTVKFGVALQHSGGKTYPGGDMTNPMPAAVTSTANGTATATNTTEVRDTTLSYTFTAIAGRTYQVNYLNSRTNSGAANVRYISRARIVAGSSPPGITDTLIAEYQTHVVETGTADRKNVNYYDRFTVGTSGTYTVATFTQSPDSAALTPVWETPSPARKLYVEDVTESADITTGKIEVQLDGDASGRPPRSGLRVRAIGRNDEMIVS